MAPRMSSVRRSLGILGMGLLASCLGDGSRALDPPDAGLSRFGSLSVAVSLDGTRVRLHSEARFLRLADIDPESAQVITGQGVWSEAIAPGRCARINDENLVEAALETATVDAHIGLLDAGDLIVNVAGQSERLTPSWIPEVLPFVSGVFYRSAAESPGLEGNEVQVSGFGGPDVGRFDVSTALPAFPALLSVGGQEPRASELLVDRAADLDVRWAGAPARPDETVYVTLRWHEGDALRCRASSSGWLRVPARELAAGLRGVDAEVLQLSVERVRRLAWRARGLDAGELVVVARDEAVARLL
jgi:hypothetical protein